ncbi:MAG: formyltransferase family protein [Alphaproteobacteria bacterium]
MSATRARLVFLCNRPFALEAALGWADVEIVAVFTSAASTEVHAVCRRAGIPWTEWHKGSVEPIIDAACKGAARIIVSNGYPWIIPATLLALPRIAVVNLHPSLLPAGRGPHPVNHAILAGLGVTGATCHYVDCGLDTGNILAQCRYLIPPDATAADLYRPLFRLEVEALRLALPRILAGDPGDPQPADGASTYRRSKADMCFDWSEPAPVCHRRVRAFNIPKLGVAGQLADGRRLRAFASTIAADAADALAPGACRGDGHALLVGTGRGVLRLDRFVWEP